MWPGVLLSLLRMRFSFYRCFCKLAQRICLHDDKVEQAKRREFEAQQCRRGVEHLSRLLEPIVWTFTTTTIVRLCLNHHHGNIFLRCSVGGLLFLFALCISLCKDDPRCQKFMGKQVWKHQSIQIGFLLICQLVISVGAYTLHSPLQRHRYFLTSFLLQSSVFSVVCRLPPKTYVLVGIWNFFVWLAQHWMLDFLNLPCILFGALHSFFACYTYRFIDHAAWSEFQATQALDIDRQYLQAVQTTLEGMLASLFDASCTCDDVGSVISCTPQLEDLLVGPGKWKASSHLCSFTASEVEAGRMQNFLEQITQNGSHRAQTLQISLHTARTSEAEEVKMFGITLPNRSDESVTCSKKCIFIGLQAQAKPALVPESGSPLLPESALEIDEDEVQEFHRMLIEHKDVRESNGVDVLSGSLSYSMENSSEGWILNYYSHQHHPTSTADASTQTEATSIHAQNGLPPRPWNGLTLQQRRLASRCSQRVTLNTSKRVLHDFCETPSSTWTFSIMDLIRYFNACGAGCCAYHIALANLAKKTKMLASGPCFEEFMPFKDWQCLSCKAMNRHVEADADSEDEDPLDYCSVCETPKHDPLNRVSEDAGIERSSRE